jgi:hypothetical protein
MTKTKTATKSAAEVEKEALMEEVARRIKTIKGKLDDLVGGPTGLAWWDAPDLDNIKRDLGKFDHELQYWLDS